MKTGPRRTPAVRTRVVRRRESANWLKFVAILLVLQSLVLQINVNVSFERTPTGWKFNFNLGWHHGKDRGEAAPTRKLQLPRSSLKVDL
jgi:hypothetical protein